MNPDNNQKPSAQPVMDVQRPKQLFEAPSVPEAQTPPPTPQPTEPVVSSGGSNKGLKIVIAISITATLLLIGIAVFYFLRSNKSEAPAPAAPAQTTQDDGKVDETDIDQATNDIDNAIKGLNDSEDFSSDDLSDSTIGL